ncbi:hypothetical protein ACHAWT_008188 [Skeletonema menzelii]|mmetsp:Transcript_6753/g.10993  ORF Transcript_6753/g.10993 Transcript_6753/m.10993 type:complete len:294 (+) Transcript_6753:60-941(+)
MIYRFIVAVALATSANGFTMPSSSASTSTRLSALDNTDFETAIETFDPLNLSEEDSSSTHNNRAAVIAAAAAFMTPLSANAAGPDWGIFEGRTGSLLHPIAMFSMAAFSVSTGLLGFQWRRQRTLGEEISSLKKSLPDLAGASSVADALQNAQSAETVDSAYVAKLKAAMPIESQINELQKERKDLASAGPKDKHFSQGALLAFIGTAFAIEGPLNTYARAGKLFPGPHLYAGAGLVVLWALAASMVPAMQKGNDAARTVHIGANLAGIGLFGWQVVSGVPILLKVVELTKWP